jgi:hypothetical protein
MANRWQPPLSRALRLWHRKPRNAESTTAIFSFQKKAKTKQENNSMKTTIFTIFAGITIINAVAAGTVTQIVEQAPSATVQSGSSDPVFSKNRAADSKVPCLNLVVVPVFRSVQTGLRQFYVHPKPIINRDSVNTGIEEVKAAVKAMGKNAGADQRYTLNFSLSLMHPQIYDEIAADLGRRATAASNNGSSAPAQTNNSPSATANFSNILASEIAILPYDTIQITAKCGQDGAERTIYSDPAPGSIQANSHFQVTDRPTQLDVTLSGTQAELEAFAAAPVMHVYTTSGAYTVKKNFVVVAAEKFLKSRAGQNLTGDDKLKNELHVKNTSSSAAVGVSLPFVGGGGSKTENDTDTKRIIQRWVSREQLLNEATAMGANLSITEWEEIGAKNMDQSQRESIIKQLVEFVLAEQKSAAFRIEILADKRLQLTNQVTKEVSVHAGNLAGWKLQSKPSNVVEASHDGKFEYGPIKVADKGSFKLDAHDEVAFMEQGNNGIVPTTVQLYQLADDDLRSRIVASYEKFVSTQQEFQLHSESENNVEVYNSNISQPGRLGLASLSTLQAGLSDLVRQGVLAVTPEVISRVFPQQPAKINSWTFPLIDTKDGVAMLLTGSPGATISNANGNWSLTLKRKGVAKPGASIAIFRVAKQLTPSAPGSVTTTVSR